MTHPKPTSIYDRGWEMTYLEPQLDEQEEWAAAQARQLQGEFVSEHRKEEEEEEDIRDSAIRSLRTRLEESEAKVKELEAVIQEKDRRLEALVDALLNKLDNR